MSYELAEDKKNKFDKKFDANVFKSDERFEDWVESLIFSQSERDGMCLLYAAMRGEAGVIKAIIAGGVPVDFKSRRRCDFPLEGSHPDDVHFNVLCGTTALHLASTDKVRTSLVQEMRKKGLPIDTRDASGRTPLICCVINNDIRGIQFMIDRGAYVSDRDPTGYTVLHHAVFTNNAETVRCVLNYRPRIVPDASGLTPADYARNYSEFSASHPLFVLSPAARQGFRSDSPVTAPRNRLARTTHLASSHLKEMAELDSLSPSPL
ncbi:MAG TPA: ankyrin repeat domain-containing protein [Gammaproteobacteria bacterium]|nr:ankyrin repeat domain-containing protein [Gammaproteobacteria bacterium]